jgi:hypothetical protein
MFSTVRAFAGDSTITRFGALRPRRGVPLFPAGAARRLGAVDARAGVAAPRRAFGLVAVAKLSPFRLKPIDV